MRCKNHSWRGLLGTLLLLLTGCSSETAITLYEDETWVVKNVSEVDMGLLPDISMGDELFPGMGLDISVETGAWTELLMSGGLDQLQPYYDAEGVKFSWDSRTASQGQTLYTLQWEGEGWDTLEATALSGAQIRTVHSDDDGLQQVTFSMPIPEDESGMLYLMDNTIHLHGQRIIRSNAHQVQGGKASWHNPQGELEATLTLAKRFRFNNLWLIGSIIAVLGVGAAITLIVILRPAPQIRGRLSKSTIKRQPSKRRPLSNTRR